MKKNHKSYGTDNDLNAKVVIALARANQTVLAVSARDFREGGLTISQFSVLEALYHKGPMRICHLIEKTLSTGGNMTVVIENLIRLGYIKKACDPEDKRASIITLTDEGFKLIEQIFPSHLESLAKVFEPLDNEDKVELIRIIKKLTRKE